MKLDKKTILTISCIAGGVVLLNWLVNHMSDVGAVLATVWSLLFPFVLGLGLAFVLNIPMRAIEKLIFKERRPRYRRTVSFLLTILAVLLVVTFMVTLVVPQLVTTVATLIEAMPGYAARIEQELQPWMRRIPELREYVQSLNLDWKEIGSNLFSLLGSGAGELLNSTVGMATTIISGATSLAIGLIFACYVLFDKERLSAQLKGVLQAYLKKKHYDGLMSLAALANHTFSRFISGQCTEAVAVALMFLVVLWVGGFDYALLISVVIGFFSLIPILGAFIGCFIGAFLIFVSSGFWRMVAFIIVFLVVQQIDGNVTYPRIVGTSIGLPPLWVLVAVTVGGGLMGIFGMLFFIPLTSLLYTLLRRHTLGQLEKKGIESPMVDFIRQNPSKAPRKKKKKWWAKKAKKSSPPPPDSADDTNSAPPPAE